MQGTIEMIRIKIAEWLYQYDNFKEFAVAILPFNDLRSLPLMRHHNRSILQDNGVIK